MPEKYRPLGFGYVEPSPFSFRDRLQAALQPDEPANYEPQEPANPTIEAPTTPADPWEDESPSSDTLDAPMTADEAYRPFSDDPAIPDFRRMEGDFWNEYINESTFREQHGMEHVTPEEFRDQRDFADHVTNPTDLMHDAPDDGTLKPGEAGGRAVFAKYGSEHMRELGKLGLQAMADKYWGGDKAKAIRRLTELGQMAGDPHPENGAWQYPKREDEPWESPAPEGLSPEGTVFTDRTILETEPSGNPVMEKLQRGLEQAMSAEGFRDYLEFRSKFRDYSPNNTLLIMTQRPDATHVAGYKKWQTMGRQVNKGEKGIAIMAPQLTKVRDEETGELRAEVRGFRTVHVFDIKSTDGKPVPEQPRPEKLTTQSERGKEIGGRVLDYLIKEGVTVSIGPVPGHAEANGCWKPSEKVIIVSDQLTGDMALKTLIHEVAHFEAGHFSGTNPVDREMIAEGSAFSVMDQIGLDSSSYSIPYLQGWGKSMEAFHRNIGEIERVSKTILDKIGGTDDDQ